MDWFISRIEVLIRENLFLKIHKALLNMRDCNSFIHFLFLYLQIIHLTWSPGIKSKQTLADDERSVSVVISLRLSGTPWNQAVYNSGKATIQARLIVLEVARVLSQHKWRFATNVNFCGTTDSFFFQVSFLTVSSRGCCRELNKYQRY